MQLHSFVCCHHTPCQTHTHAHILTFLYIFHLPFLQIWFVFVNHCTNTSVYGYCSFVRYSSAPSQITSQRSITAPKIYDSCKQISRAPFLANINCHSTPLRWHALSLCLSIHRSALKYQACCCCCFAVCTVRLIARPHHQHQRNSCRPLYVYGHCSSLLTAARSCA